MLTEEERAEILAQVEDCPDKRAASVEALKIVQQHRGWVADELMADLANTLDMTVDELDAVATFYPFVFRKPVGRHVIFVCDSLSCWIMGYENVFESLAERLGVSWGGTTADNRFTLLPVSCIGACDRAPAMMVDGEVHGDLSPEKIEAILQRYV